jgi:hypothetical protein
VCEVLGLLPVACSFTKYDCGLTGSMYRLVFFTTPGRSATGTIGWDEHFIRGVDNGGFKIWTDRLTPSFLVLWS